MASANSRNQYLFVQEESTYGTIPNSAGTATLAGTDACRHISLVATPVQPLNDRPDKTGNLSATVGVGGRKSSTWRASMSMAGSGAAGTESDIKKFLKALFGKAPVIVGATSVTHDVDDTQFSLDIWNFYDPSGMVQEVALGAIVNQGRFILGQDFATAEFEGEARWVLDSNQFATADATAKGGLTSFPARPTPTTNGIPAIGFTGTITLDGNVYTFFRNATIIFNAQRELPKDIFNSYYPDSPAQDVRDVRVEFQIYDDDGANFKSLRLKAINKTAVTLTFVIGTVAGNIWTFTLRNVIFDAPERDDSQRKLSTTWRGKAHADSSTSKNEITLALT